MKKYLTLMGILVVLAFSLTMFSGCAEKKAVVKDEAVQEQKVQPAETIVSQDDEAARRAKEQAEREAALRAQAEKDRLAREAAAAAALYDGVKDINFDFDKSNIRPDAREIMKGNADIFLKNGATEIVIEGYCDERGTAEYNMALGERRAQEAKKYLTNLGIKASQMKTVSYGEERPLDPGNNEEAWAKNRRAHFVVNSK